MLVRCDKCGGSGEIECPCNQLKWVLTTYDRGSMSGYEKRGIEQCSKCNQYYRVIIQFDHGTGHDDKLTPITADEANRVLQAAQL